MNGRNILVVDDEPEVRNVLTALLQGMGYTVTATAGADEAIKHARLEKPDIVLTDIIMPDGEGIELIQMLSRLSSPPAVIAMSGHRTGSKFFRAAQLFGAVAILEKPFSPDALEHVLRQVGST